MGCKHIPIPHFTKFGRLTTTDAPTSLPPGKGKGEIYYEAICECGTIKNYASWKLKSGHSRSCGCLRKDHLHAKGLKTLIKKGVALAQSELDFKAKVEKEQS